MGKNFNQWLNEFVDNGADAKDVTNWPENAGGGSTVVANPTLVGDEPDLTGLEVDGAKYKVPQGGSAGIEYIQVNIGGGTLTAEQLAKVFDNGIVKEGVFFRLDNIILVSSGHPRKQVFNSTVIDGKYYSMEVDEFTGAYTITEISVGGGSQLYTYYIKAEDVGNMHYNYSCTFQCERPDINSYNTLAEYLIGKGFYPRGDRFNPDSVPLLKVAAEGGKFIVTGLYAIKSTNPQDVYAYRIYANNVFLSQTSKDLTRGNNAVINPQTFSITLITK